MKLYKHKNNTDVAFKINQTKEDKNYLHLQISWYNIVSKPSFFIERDSIKIKKSDLKNWIIIKR